MSRSLLDTGQPALWDTQQQARLDRCPGCEHHVDTQGHHPYCPRKATS